MEQKTGEKDQVSVDKGAAQPSPSLTSTQARRRTKTKMLPSDRIKFTTQMEVLRAYGAISGSSGKLVSVKEAAESVKITESTAALLNGYFVENGFLQRGEGGFVPTQNVINYANAVQWEQEDPEHKLLPIVEATWFAQALVPLLRMRPYEENEALGKLAEISQAGPEYKNQLRILLDYMETAGIIQRDGTQIKLCKANPPAGIQGNEKPPLAPLDPAIHVKPPGASGSPAQPVGGVQFGVNISVDMAELAGWSPDRISALFSGIAQVLSAKAKIERGE